MNEEEYLKNIHDDYTKIRDEMYEILTDAKDALKLAKSILEESEHPRAVEVYSGLLKNVNSVQAQIIDLTKTYKDILQKAPKERPSDPALPPPPGTTNMFLTTTKDLADMLADQGFGPKSKLIEHD